MLRRTRVVLSVPWDDEDTDHPAGWNYDQLIGVPDRSELGVLLVDFEDLPQASLPEDEAV